MWYLAKNALFYVILTTWLAPSLAVLYSYYLKVISIDPISISMILILYSLIWYKASEKLIVRFGLPRASPNRVEELSAIIGLKNLDPKLAYYIDKWIQDNKTRARTVPSAREEVHLQRIIVPASTENKGSVPAPITERRASLRDIYENTMEIQIEEDLENIAVGGRVESGTVEEAGQRSEGSRGVTVSPNSEARSGENTLSDLISLLSKKNGCLIMQALKLGAFRIKDLKELCNSHWQTVRSWIDSALELGIAVEIESNLYRIDEKRFKEIINSLFVRGGGG